MSVQLVRVEDCNGRVKDPQLVQVVLTLRTPMCMRNHVIS